MPLSLTLPAHTHTHSHSHSHPSRISGPVHLLQAAAWLSVSVAERECHTGTASSLRHSLALPAKVHVPGAAGLPKH